MEQNEQSTYSTSSSPLKKIIVTIFQNIFSFGLALIIVFLIHTFIGRPFIVNGQSMDPNIKHKDFLLVDALSLRLRPVERGEVIVFRSPTEEKKYFIKRVIGLPGEKVQIAASGAVTIYNDTNPNGFMLDSSFITHTSGIQDTRILPENSYYVMGDNRANSFDSRMWGVLPEENIIGRAFIRLYPFDNIDYLPARVSYDE